MPFEFPLIGARTAIWLVAQLHLFFAAQMRRQTDPVLLAGNTE